MTRTIDEEKDQQAKIEAQQVEVSVNGTTETLRPEALHLKGVDNLSTDDIKAFVDYYVNYRQEDGKFVPNDPPHTFRVQWVDDLKVNVVFKTHEDAKLALDQLSIFANSDPVMAPEGELTQEYVSEIIQEREAKPYSPSIALHKYLKELEKLATPQEDRDLFEQKKETVEQQRNEMDEDESSVVLYVRLAFQSDRKVKNAAAYSRYYLLHGEPDRTKPRPRKGRGRGQYAREEREEEDLFADKVKGRREQPVEEEEDLFAWRLRERSPSRR